MRKVVKQLIVICGLPFTIIASLWLRFVRKNDQRSLSFKIFEWVGMVPIPDHYYQPLVLPKKHLYKSLRDDRALLGIDLNSSYQLYLLSQFHFQKELLSIPLNPSNRLEFYYNNDSFGSGDAEILYSMIRHFKPRNIIEIGSGNSTLLSLLAIEKNHTEGYYINQHICIEPYEKNYLDLLPISLMREKVERLGAQFFEILNENDILFIDSSHIIRPQGDVLFEYLELLPSLKSGVIIHFHDIFLPKDYPEDWIIKEHRLWNEQYLLEAFLSHNQDFEIICAVNYLKHHHLVAFKEIAPIFANQSEREPGSFWIRRK